MMKAVGKQARIYFWVIGVGLGLVPTAYAENIVASGSTIDIDNGTKFDEAIITISGPNGFSEQFNLQAGETQLQIDDLGISESGNYIYQIQYVQQGKIEYISDAKTGREGAPRNTGKIQSSSGYFNVIDGEFITEEVTEASTELKAENTQATDHSELNSNVSNMAENAADRQQGQ